MSRLALLLSLAMIACGSRSPIGESGALAEDGSSPGERPASNGGSGSTLANGGSGSALPDRGAGGTASTDDGSRDALPPCVPGLERRAARAGGVDCNWLVSGRCYEDRLDACACACPRDRDSTCISGSPGDEVDVTCF